MKNNVNFFNPNYPSTNDLRIRTRKRIPRFAFDYLESGANEEVNLSKNHRDFQDIELMPEYIKDYSGADLRVELMGQHYDAPFGISPIGLQGLMWPNSPEILAKSAVNNNIPFVLSTDSIEHIAEDTKGQYWFQLYHPSDDRLRDSLLQRAWDSGCRTLVLLADTPTFGIRYKDIKNGLSMPPKMSVSNIVQVLGHPNWAAQTLYYGLPSFLSLMQYMPKGMNLKQLGKFMNETFNGRLTEEKIRIIREKWKGKLVIKGIVNQMDLERCIDLGIDGIIVSNHGGRQIDAGESTIRSLQKLNKSNNGRITMMMDGGIRSGVDVVKALACGADFVFMGRPFMYGVGALGKRGGNHTITLFKNQIRQTMEQVGCEKVSQLPKCLIT